jgi:hypothetical protein
MMQYEMTTSLIILIIVAAGTAVAILLAVVVRLHFTSRRLYRKNVGQPAKMNEMREEQWDAIEDENAYRHQQPTGTGEADTRPLHVVTDDTGRWQGDSGDGA